MNRLEVKNTEMMEMHNDISPIQHIYNPIEKQPKQLYFRHYVALGFGILSAWLLVTVIYRANTLTIAQAYIQLNVMLYCALLAIGISNSKKETSITWIIVFLTAINMLIVIVSLFIKH